MKFTPKKRRSPADVNMIPLIDLFLNILVFFMVTTTFASTSLFYVDLPEAQSSDAPRGERRQVAIDVGATGEVAVDRKNVTMQELRANLEEIPKEQRNNIPVLIRADRSSLHGRVIAVIDIVKETGFHNLGIATKSQQ